MKIEIEDDVPVPTTPLLRKYPIEELDIGQSCVLPAKRSTVHAYLHHARKRTGFKFIIRAVDGGIRVWRVS